MTTRLNADNQIEVLIEDLQGYAPLVVSSVMQGGYTVKLTPQQLAIIESIGGLVQQLSQSFGSEGLTGLQLNSLITAVNGLRQQELPGIIDRLNSLGQLEAIANSSDQNAQAIAALAEAITNMEVGGGVLAGAQTIETFVLTTANQQYSYVFPAGTVRYAFSCRGDEMRNDPVGYVRFAWVEGMVAPSLGQGNGVDDYDVLLPENEESADQYFSAATTLYLAGDTPGIILTIRRWDNANP